MTEKTTEEQRHLIPLRSEKAMMETVTNAMELSGHSDIVIAAASVVVAVADVMGLQGYRLEDYRTMLRDIAEQLEGFEFVSDDTARESSGHNTH